MMLELESSSQAINSTHPHKDVSIPIVDHEITYDEFFRLYMEPNRPCIFPPQLTQEWPARNLWVKNAEINVKYLSNEYGSSEVPVADCEEKHYDSQRKETFLLQNYINNYWLARHCAETKVQEKCLYLKDWHFVRAYPDAHVYQTPKFFCSDWLNEFWEGRPDCTDDYRFVYLGPKGSWTPFHSDVFRSFSWSSNVSGRKRWIFFPPGAEGPLRDRAGSLPYDVTTASPDLAGAGAVSVVQAAGETVFVPSGWHHQVCNLEDTLSINHNWINATNITAVWQQLISELAKVEDAISDCRGMENWHDQCQLVLKASHGMDLIEYFSFLRAIAEPRIAALKSGDEVEVLDGRRQGKHHTLYDVKRLREAVIALLDHGLHDQLDAFDHLDQRPDQLLDQLTEVLGDCN